jgi:Spy/CpxP family protein refolding chaperone
MKSLVILCSLAVLAVAQPAPPQQPPSDPIGERLFPAELVMTHQREINLDDKTRAAIVEDIQKFQAQAVKLQWDMKTEGDTLTKLLDDARPDEAKVLAQADKIMALERDMKRAHLGLLVRIKGRLTPAQQATLQKLRAKR